jgi:hypothetical protein
MELNKINKILDSTKHHVFYKGKELKQLSQKTINDIKKSIKEHVNPPKTDKKVYLVSLKYNPESEKRKIIIACGQYTITSKLALAKGNDDDSFSIIYSSDELKKYKFDLTHIKKIINKIKKEELDMSVQFINISEILG